MSDDAQHEALVMKSADGQYYAIPRAVVEAHAVTDPRQRAYWDQIPSSDVQGYAFDPSAVRRAAGVSAGPFVQPGTMTTLFTVGAQGFAFATTAEGNPFVQLPYQSYGDQS